MSARINFIIRAFNETVDNLKRTIKSISEIDYDSKFISIITNQENVEKISIILNEIDEPSEIKNSLFNKNSYGVPTLCLVFGLGKIRVADALNSLIEQTLDSTDLFSFVFSGDLLNTNYCSKIIETIDEFPGIVGLVYSDYYLNGLRIFVEPFIKEKISNKWELIGYNIPKYVFERKGLFLKEDDSEGKYLSGIIQDHIASHIPEPLLNE